MGYCQWYIQDVNFLSIFMQTMILQVGLKHPQSVRRRQRHTGQGRQEKIKTVPVQMVGFGGGDGGKESYGLSVNAYSSHRLAMW